MKTCCVCGKPIEKGQRYFNGFRGGGPPKHRDCSGPGAITDSQRLDWLEQTAMGSGKSRWIKSMFICRELGGDRIVLEVKGEEHVFAGTIREAIDIAMGLPNSNSTTTGR